MMSDTLYLKSIDVIGDPSGGLEDFSETNVEFPITSIIPLSASCFDDFGMEQASSDSTSSACSSKNPPKVKRKSETDQQQTVGKKQCHQKSSSVGSFDCNISGVSCSTTNTSGISSILDNGIGSEITSPTSSVVVEHQNYEIFSWLSNFELLSEYDKLQALTCLVNKCNLDQVRHLHRVIEPLFQKDFISQLPVETALKILSNLSPRDLLNVAASCRNWRKLSEDYELWRQHCRLTKISPSSLPPPPSTSAVTPFERSPKSVFLRYSKIQSKWRRGPPLREVTLRGHDDHVITCLQVNGDKIVSGSDDNTLKVWSSESGRCLHTLQGHTGGVWCSQLTENGEFVISGSTDRTVKVWDLETGLCVYTLIGHTSTVRCMALKNNILVSGSRDSTLRVWNVQTGECVHTLMGHLAAVRCVQFDGRRAVSGAYDYTIKVWDVESENCVHTLAGHTNRVYSLQFDSENNIVVSGSLDTSIRVWEIVNGQCLFTLVGHQSLTSGMQLRGKILVSGNADSMLKVWDISTGRCLHTLSGPDRHMSAVTSLQFLESGLVATSSDDGTVKLWDTVTGEFVRNVVRLPSGGSGGCIWRLRATASTLICAVGSRNGTEDTKLMVFDFNADYPSEGHHSQ